MNTLFKIRRCMKKNMTQSGTHSNCALDFVDAAMNTVKGGRSFHRTGIFYFYCWCEEHGESLDAAFRPFLDESLKSDTAELSEITDQPNSRKRKNEAAFAIERIATSSDKIGDMLGSFNKEINTSRVESNANFQKISDELYDTVVRAGRGEMAAKYLREMLGDDDDE